MSAILKMEDWADKHHPKVIDFVRILLGLVLVLKGFSFADHENVIHNLLAGSSTQYLAFMGAQYFVLVTICGGLLITFGLLTRITALLEIPILIAEVFFVSLPQKFLVVNSGMAVSVVVLFLLLFYMLFGSGKVSIDNYMKSHPDINVNMD
jgi:putative oxidoreductase